MEGTFIEAVPPAEDQDTNSWGSIWHQIEDGKAPPTAVEKRKRKRKKKEPQPESVIIFHSLEETKDTEEEPPAGDKSEADGTPSADEASTTPSLLPKFNERIAAQNDLGDGHFVTLTGTITRGKKKGHLVDIHLSLTEKELLELSGQDEAEGGGPGQPLTEDRSRSRCRCGLARGPHVVVWSVLCAPFVFAVALVVAFYYGTITWYNVFLVYNEQRTFWHKVTLCPLLMLFYPPLIMAASIALALHAVTSQITCTFAMWWQAARDPEKGFFGWLCSHLGLEECAPYSIVELLDSQSLPTGRPIGAHKPLTPTMHTSAV
uniref:transmembrane protein 169 n=1 Tax=Myxine glutinosa TaxID=7769 RepID=UPI00358FB39D